MSLEGGGLNLCNKHHGTSYQIYNGTDLIAHKTILQMGLASRMCLEVQLGRSLILCMFTCKEVPWNSNINIWKRPQICFRTICLLLEMCAVIVGCIKRSLTNQLVCLSVRISKYITQQRVDLICFHYSSAH